MISTMVGGIRRRAAIVGGCVALTLVGFAAHLDQTSQVHAASNTDGQAISVTTPSETPAITKAEPSITGPAPLYAAKRPTRTPRLKFPDRRAGATH